MILSDYILKKYQEQTNIDLSTDEQAMYRINDAAKKAIIELRSMTETDINLPFITADKEGPKHLHIKIDKNWDKQDIIDTDELIFQKHRIHKPEEKNRSLIFIVFAILIIALSGLLVFLLS